jgi:2-methylcitrate dehydratase PrpD
MNNKICELRYICSEEGNQSPMQRRAAAVFVGWFAAWRVATGNSGGESNHVHTHVTVTSAAACAAAALLPLLSPGSSCHLT